MVHVEIVFEVGGSYLSDVSHLLPRLVGFDYAVLSVCDSLFVCGTCMV